MSRRQTPHLQPCTFADMTFMMYEPALIMEPASLAYDRMLQVFNEQVAVGSNIGATNTANDTVAAQNQTITAMQGTITNLTQDVTNRDQTIANLQAGIPQQQQGGNNNLQQQLQTALDQRNLAVHQANTAIAQRNQAVNTNAQLTQLLTNALDGGRAANLKIHEPALIMQLASAALDGVLHTTL